MRKIFFQDSIVITEQQSAFCRSFVVFVCSSRTQVCLPPRCLRQSDIFWWYRSFVIYITFAITNQWIKGKSIYRIILMQMYHWWYNMMTYLDSKLMNTGSYVKLCSKRCQNLNEYSLATIIRAYLAIIF